ncbi:MAG: hypothetical protein ACRD50_03695 [Candidatus Acidiferrales bacterium]
MTDFIRTMAPYSVDNDVILTTLAELENAGVFVTECKEASRLAKVLVGKDAERSIENKVRFAKCLRDRAPESIEDLIERSSRVTASSSSAGLKDRFLFSINQLFSIVGWNVGSAPLEQFLRHQFENDGPSHTFVSFNYDLILDRTIQMAKGSNWHPADGYGFRIPYFTTEDPPVTNSAAGVLPRARAIQFDDPGGTYESAIQILKPHGSLNWLLPFEVPYRTGKHGLTLQPQPMVLPLELAGGLRYWSTSANFNHIQCPGAHPHDYGIFIIPPSSEKRSDLNFLEKIRTREMEAILECENIFVIGYSLPVTDADQELLIRSIVERRSAGITRLIVVNYHAAPDYFQRVAEVFAFPRQRLEVFNSGFTDFVNRFCTNDSTVASEA